MTKIKPATLTLILALMSALLIFRIVTLEKDFRKKETHYKKELMKLQKDSLHVSSLY